MREASSEQIFARSPDFSLRHRKGRRLRWRADAGVDYGLVFLLSGELRWQANENADGSIAKGGILLAGPGDGLQASSSGACEFLSITLSSLFVLEKATHAKMLRGEAFVTFRVHAVESDARLMRLAVDLSDELTEQGAGQEVVIRAIIDQMLVHTLRRYANVKRSEQLELSRAGLVDRRVRRAVELMHANLSRELPLDEIADAAHLSPFHFARLFKKLTGSSPHAYLAALRAVQAQKLLAETDLSIIEVGSHVGYASPSHFAKAFRQATGISPRAFRKALR
jgi:AraC family transcriptional regulator